MIAKVGFEPTCVTPYEGAALPVEPLCSILIAGHVIKHDYESWCLWLTLLYVSHSPVGWTRTNISALGAE